MTEVRDRKSCHAMPGPTSLYEQRCIGPLQIDSSKTEVIFHIFDQLRIVGAFSIRESMSAAAENAERTLGAPVGGFGGLATCCLRNRRTGLVNSNSNIVLVSS